MGKITLTWEDQNPPELQGDGFRIYRSIGTPLDLDNLPPHVGETTATTYEDNADFEDKVVHYAVSAFVVESGGTVERVSDQISFDTDVPYTGGV